MDILLGILIPFIGTILGSFIVFFMKDKVHSKIEKLLLGFASGVMIAASIWSLLIPAINMTNGGWVSPALGFIFGILFLTVIDKITNRCEQDSRKPSMLAFAVTLHNLPEGMAVGIIFAAFLSGSAGVTLASAYALAIGIAIQNFPEGAIISLPMKASGSSKLKAFIYGVLSGVVEPIGAFLTICLTKFVVPILPFMLSFAAGAMIYVVVEELVPEIHEKERNSYGIIGVALGFVIMMVLDITLG